RVESVTVARGRHELRVHRVLGAPDGARAELTGWATEPGGPVRSQLYGLHGWEAREEVRAPQGTAFTRWAVLPRLAADTTGTAVLVALASLTAEPPEPPSGPRPTAGPAPSADPLETVVDKVEVRRRTGPDGVTVEVRWAEDGTRTRIAFGRGTV
nr:hypothetical protein [Streptomyces sp. DSM 41633]